jgi:hypothetical protein
MGTFAPLIQLNMRTMSGFANLKRLIAVKVLAVIGQMDLACYK